MRIHRNTESLEGPSKDTQSKPSAVQGDISQPYQLCWAESSKSSRTYFSQGVQISFLRVSSFKWKSFLVPNLNFPCCGLQPLFLLTLFGTTKKSLVSGCWKYSSTSHLHCSQIALSCLSPTSTNSWTEAILAAFWSPQDFLHHFWLGDSKL